MGQSKNAHGSSGVVGGRGDDCDGDPDESAAVLGTGLDADIVCQYRSRLYGEGTGGCRVRG
jgi:hypothetical protein